MAKFTLIISLLCGAFLCVHASQPSRNSKYQDYIEQYAEMARSQQAKHGIPASITLAQGLLESGAGTSRLATEGNNHFGIKCHADWKGPTILRDDDKPDECFRVYESPEQSFEDHSQFLHKSRYNRLFDLDPADYSGWAHGLKACGYATSPTYAYKLIAIIETYELYNYDLGRQAAAQTDDADFILEHLKNLHPVRRGRGLHYVIAVPGDTYASIAKELNVDGALLARYNDADSADTAIRAWEEVYLQPKLDSAPDKIAKATIGEDENAHVIAQRYGVKMELIHALNPGFEDRPGTVLKLKK